jgi:hypothetical protein
MISRPHTCYIASNITYILPLYDLCDALMRRNKVYLPLFSILVHPDAPQHRRPFRPTLARNGPPTQELPPPAVPAPTATTLMITPRHHNCHKHHDTRTNPTVPNSTGKMTDLNIDPPLSATTSLPALMPRLMEEYDMR